VECGRCSCITRIYQDDPRIAYAKSIKEVWPEYDAHLESKLDGGRKVGMILGWNGKVRSEMTKFFKICEVKYRGVLFICPGGGSSTSAIPRNSSNTKRDVLYNMKPGGPHASLYMHWVHATQKHLGMICFRTHVRYIGP
jgi:hypothetical protein